MVGYDPHSVQLSQAEYVAAGGVSGAVSRAVAQPLDVLKIRFQLQIEPIKTLSSSKYHGVIQAVGKIVQEEGLGALWKGHVPAQGLSILYGLSQFAMFELLTKHVGSRYPQACSTNLLPLTHFVCGAMSSSLTTFVVQPIDVLRTRFVAQGEPKMYTSVRSAAVTICKKESFFALYRGLSPALICVAPQMGLQFGFYALLTSIWKAVSGRSEADRPGPVESLVCGSGAGVLSKLIVFPLDLVKKRLQVQGMEAARVGFGETRRYRGLLHCLRVCVRGVGVGGAYKGLTPSLMKAAVVAGLHLSVYEQVCQLFALRYH